MSFAIRKPKRDGAFQPATSSRIWSPNLTFLSLCLVITASPTLCAESTPLPLHVAGNLLVDSSNNAPLLRGVNICSMEWLSAGDHILQSVQEATTEWHANIVRIPVTQDFWFGKEKGQTDGGAAYRQLFDQVVKLAEANGAYVDIDLQWSDGGQWGEDIGQHKMPDENSIAFWKSAASIYANDPGVVFDLYNEPHNISWEIWQNGGQLSDHSFANRTASNHAYQCVGMQAMLDAVRSTGAKNVVFVGGINWSYDFDGILHGSALSDPGGNGIVYTEHFYPNKGDTVSQWQRKMYYMTKKYPVFVEEFGNQGRKRDGTINTEWIKETLSVMKANGYSWMAWSYHTQAGPTLISDWNYTPTPYYGIYVKRALSAN